MKTALTFTLKLAVTLGIFVLIFIEFGGGFVPVDTGTLRAPGAFEVANPAYPGIVGRLRARFTGAAMASSLRSYRRSAAYRDTTTCSGADKVTVSA